MIGRLKGAFVDVLKTLKGVKRKQEMHGMESVEYVITQEEKEKAGWVSPAYTQSKSIKLNLNVLADNRCVAFFPQMSESEMYKVLRTQILHYTKAKLGNTIMITSALPGEGKTLTAINLSLTFAKQFDQTVLLIDCDLRKQHIHKTLGFESDRGIINFLIEDQPVSDLINWPGIDKLTIISGGPLIHESTELLGSPKTKDLLREMKTRYSDRYIFFDVPPILSDADAIAFAPLVDYVIIVIHSGVTSIDDVKKALDLIPKEKVIGFVLNRHHLPVKTYSINT